MAPAAQYLDTALKEGQPPSQVSAWLKQNVQPGQLQTPEAARTMMRALLTHYSAPGAAAQLKKYAAVAVELYGGESDAQLKLQLSMVHEIVLFCDELKFEAGLVKRLFHAVYEYDMILEDTFVAWQEDPEEVQGKRQALLHANPFLQWLATADEEDDSDDDA